MAGKRSVQWYKNKAKVKKLRIKKKEEFESSPLLKKAKRHVIIGFTVFLLYCFSQVGFDKINAEISTGKTFSGVVIDWAADGPKRNDSELRAKVELENGFIFYILFKGHSVGETLEFNEFKHKVTGNYKYRLK